IVTLALQRIEGLVHVTGQRFACAIWAIPVELLTQNFQRAFESFVHSFLGLTSKMSHDGSWRAACRITIRSPGFHFGNSFGRTRRDRSRRWLWRLVRHF